MSSAVRLTTLARRAITCHPIRPAAKTIPTAAAIQAFVVEVKIKSNPFNS